MAFITESVDSRNHVIVAVSVTAGLAASALRFGLLDMVVGLVVALLILWSAIELTVDLLRTSSDGRIDLAHYGFWVHDVYEHFCTKFVRHWLLRLVARQEVPTRTELLERVRATADFSDNPWMKAVGLDRPWLTESAIEENLNEILSRGWATGDDHLLLTEAGKRYLEKHPRFAPRPRHLSHTKGGYNEDQVE
jgi:hypothetical protein